MGQFNEALDALHEAEAVIQRTGERRWEAEIHRMQGALLLSTSGITDDAQKRFERALVLARDQGARSLELRAATSMGRLWLGNKNRSRTCDLLSPVLSRFTEGLETSDVRDARQVLLAVSGNTDQASFR
jgi:predicted ATPase